MLSLPYGISPDEVQLEMPEFSVKTFIPSSGASKHSFLLGGVYYDAKIKFKYNNLPYCDDSGCRSSNYTPEIERVLNFWMECRSSLLPFIIEDNHPLWEKSVLSNYFKSLIKPYHVWFWGNKPTINEDVKGFVDITGEFILKVKVRFVYA